MEIMTLDSSFECVSAPVAFEALNSSSEYSRVIFINLVNLFDETVFVLKRIRRLLD